MKKVSLDGGVWGKVSPVVADSCKKGQKLSSSGRLDIVKKKANYMANDSKDTTRKTVDNIAKKNSGLYSKTFADTMENEASIYRSQGKYGYVKYTPTCPSTELIHY